MEVTWTWTLDRNSGYPMELASQGQYGPCGLSKFCGRNHNQNPIANRS